MKRRRFILYVLLSGLLLLVALTVYVYQEYLGENSDLALESGQNPIITQRINGIVTHAAENSGSHPQKLDVIYTDIESNKAAHFTINAEYKQRIHPGDTVKKDKGEKILLVYQKGGKLAIVPID